VLIDVDLFGDIDERWPQAGARVGRVGSGAHVPPGALLPHGLAGGADAAA
jgi:hypothetical protein